MTTTALAPRQPELLLSARTGSLDQYIHAANTVPMLTAEEEHDLAVKFRDTNDLDAARRLVLAHLRFVVHVARGYAGYGLQIGDLIQEGNVGLMKAVKRFDPERGVRLVSFALHWIRAEMHEYILRNWRLVKVATTKAQRKLFFNLRSMKASTAALSVADAAKIAKDLGVKPEDVVEMETRLTGHDLALDPTPGDEENFVSPIAYLTDTDDEPAKIYERARTAEHRTKGLQSALSRLDDRSRRIIEARWLKEDDSTSTLQELANEYGVSAERIRQIESKAMKTIRGQMVQAL